MNLPPFDNFMESLAENDFEDLESVKIKIGKIISVEDFNNPENIYALIEDLYQAVCNNVAMFASMNTVAYLKAYHEWLSEQL